jgi:hypothetical protein
MCRYQGGAYVENHHFSHTTCCPIRLLRMLLWRIVAMVLLPLLRLHPTGCAQNAPAVLPMPWVVLRVTCSDQLGWPSLSKLYLPTMWLCRLCCHCCCCCLGSWLMTRPVPAAADRSPAPCPHRSHTTGAFRASTTCTTALVTSGPTPSPGTSVTVRVVASPGMGMYVMSPRAHSWNVIAGRAVSTEPAAAGRGLRKRSKSHAGPHLPSSSHLATDGTAYSSRELR